MAVPQTTESSDAFSAVRAWAELVRLPNVFTSAADVLMGYQFVSQAVARDAIVWTLVVCSCALYMAGMVWNDYFDRDEDARLRPRRPIPSGRIGMAAARRFGIVLLIAGLGASGIAALSAHSPWPALVAAALAGCVWSYDALVKRTPFAPLAMGGCRGLNVLLGMSLAPAWHAPHALVATAIAVYIAGVTWFARTEAQQSNRALLTAALAVMAAGLALLWALPVLLARRQGMAVDVSAWRLLLALLAGSVLWRAVWAVVNPVPQRVQFAVRHAILSLVVLDAAVCLAATGTRAAIVVLVLVLPAMYLGRWIYST